MGKIVEKPIRIDLHIHSVVSRHKDGNLVAGGTEENIPLLVSKLSENSIDMCAITDHDKFSYSMYKALKQHEGNELKKVLPGVEFSVAYDGKTVIHIVTIFNDIDDEQVKRIETILDGNFSNGKYDKKIEAYSLEGYVSTLKDIGIDFVMIAHQKQSLTSKADPQIRDANSLGMKTFNELLFMEYFDAYEFRNKDNEVYNKNYALDKGVKEKLRMITGSDCHKWDTYPNTYPEEKELKFTYLKALPTFKGLVMAITDIHRINYAGSFWGQGKHIDELKILIHGKENRIPLSKGINVIIGDNSIGKSMLLHELTSERELSTNARLKRGYEKYLEKNEIQVETRIDEKDIFKFNYQGQIREIFDDENLKADKYLCEFYPNTIDAERYKKIVSRELENYYEQIRKRFEYEEKCNQLSSITLWDEEVKENELVLGIEIESKSIDNLQKLVSKIQSIIDDITNEVFTNPEFEENDRKRLENEVELLRLILEKYSERYEKAKLERTKINAFNTALNRYSLQYKDRQTDRQNKYNTFIEDKKRLCENIASLIKTSNSFTPYKCGIEETIVKPETNVIDDFCFVSKIVPEKIDDKYFLKLVEGVLKSGKRIDMTSITREQLREIIKSYPSDIEDPLEALRSKIEKKLESDFKPSNTITENGKDVYSKLSSGFNSRIYFKLLSGEGKNKGIYIIDQPEDHIAQKAIKDEVLEQFRNMAKRRQVIMVTHNPQFIVNLDVDNVIYIGKNEKEVFLQSGALEYEDEEYSILKLIAENIDGGLQTIQKRVKRYEKNIQY